MGAELHAGLHTESCKKSFGAVYLLLFPVRTFEILHILETAPGIKERQKNETGVMSTALLADWRHCCRKASSTGQAVSCESCSRNRLLSGSVSYSHSMVLGGLEEIS